MKKINIILALFASFLMMFSNPVAAGEIETEHCLTDDEFEARQPNDLEALEGIKTGRIFWDVTIGDPRSLAGRLGVIDQTYRDMVRQNVTPDMILAFRGGAVRLLASDLTGFAEESHPAVQDVQRSLRQMMDLPGVRMESCYIAMRRVPLEPENLIRGIVTVNNTFLSAMGYGQKGYISLPIQ